MQRLPAHKATSIDKELYQDILGVTKAILKAHFDKVIPMYVNPMKKQQLVGWHLLLSKDEENARYFVLYETKLFDSVAQIRLLRGEYQLQYTLEPNNIIRLSQFRLRDIDEDYDDWDDANDQVIMIGQPISSAEAKSLLLELKAGLSV